MDTFLQDLRYGLRTLAKAPVFTAVAVLTLALGIGANTSIFSVINALMLRPLPVRDPQRLAIVGNPARVHSFSSGSPQIDILSVPLYRELARNQDAFDGVAATGYFAAAMVSIDEAGQATEPERVSARLVSGNFFSVLGVDAAIGHVFRSDSDQTSGADPYVVISNAYWTRRFNRDPGIVGRTIRVNGYPLTVVGVAPAGFVGEVVGDSQDIWVPLSMQPQVIRGYNWLNDVGSSWLVLVGRLKPGMTIDQAQARIRVAYQQLAASAFASRFNADDQKELRSKKIQVSPGAAGLSGLRHQLSQPLMLLMAIVVLVLLIACVNVANLLLARSSARQKEIAVRLALGGSSARIVRQLLTESALLGLLGGALGLLFAQWGTRALLALVRGGTPVPIDTTPDPRVLAFTFLVSLLAGVLFGLVPALRATGVELTPALNSATRSGSSAASRWSAGRLLVAAQVGLSVLVLFSAGLLVQTLRKLHAVDTGYERQHLLLLRVNPKASGYHGAAYMSFCDDLLRRFRALPGVTAATYSKNGIFSGNESIDGIIVPGFQPRSDQDSAAYDDSVGPNYFTSIGIPLLRGRDIAPQDLAEVPKVTVINESMARFYFPGQDPIGRTFRFEDLENPNIVVQVVGVAKDVRDHDLRNPAPRRFYIPVNQLYLASGEMVFEMRTAANPAALEQTVRSVLRQVDPQLPILSLSTVDALVDNWMIEQILVARLSSFFAALALLLACVGLYGITSYAVAGRTREIGVRMALGARQRQVLWLVVREALLLVVAGLLLGIPGAVAGSRLLRSMLYEVSSADPGALALSITVLVGVGLAAAYLPARRATRVDPMVALRYE